MKGGEIMKMMSELKYHYGLKVRCWPNQAQKRIIKANSDASRFVYNSMVAIDKELYQLKRVTIYIKLVQDRIDTLTLRKKSLKELANHYQFLYSPDIIDDTKGHAKRSYQAAWKMFRKVHRAGTPNFHKKSYAESFQVHPRYDKHKLDCANLTNGTIKFLDDDHIKLPKLGSIRVSGSHKRLLAKDRAGSEIRMGTVSIKKDTVDGYYISMQLASDTPFVDALAKTDSKIGIDLNLDNFLMTSEGMVVSNPRYYRTIQHKLAKAQRTLSRRQLRAKKEHRNLRDAKNYQKQRQKVATILNKVRGQRNDFLHNLSTILVKNHDLVAAEELRSSNLLKNHALAMSISDVGWRTFLGMLTYKADLYGRTFITVNPKNTTQTCSDCGFVMGTEGTDKLTLAQREWTCPHCGVHHIRDVNAAKNILARAL